MPNTHVSTFRKDFIHLTADTGKFVRPSAHAHVKLLHSVDQVRDVPPVLEIGFNPPKKRANFDVRKTTEVRTLYFDPNYLTITNYCCPTVFYSINKTASKSSGIYFVP